MNRIRLGVNIDHVATIRNARGGIHPDPIKAALLAQEAGADGITAHLREDRRHMTDDDMVRLREAIALPLNMEMAATDEMLSIALQVKPHAVCLVPERREEITTEGGLDVVSHRSRIEPITHALKEAGIRVSLFIEPDRGQLHVSHEIGADIVELHTGQYCHQTGAQRQACLEAIRTAAAYTAELGLECHAGHGLTYDTVTDIAALPEVVELNIGHFLIGEAIFSGLSSAIHTMRGQIDRARQEHAA